MCWWPFYGYDNALVYESGATTQDAWDAYLTHLSKVKENTTGPPVCIVCEKDMKDDGFHYFFNTSERGHIKCVLEKLEEVIEAGKLEEYQE